MIVRLSLFLELVALRLNMVGDDGLDNRFCATIGTCRANRAMFGNRDHVGEARCVPIDGSRGGEYDIGYIMLGHGTKKTDGAVDIGSIVFERDFAGLANSLRKY